MSNSVLQELLENRVPPKTLDLSSYMKLDKLHGYQYLTSECMNKLLAGKTIVKYINRYNVPSDEHLEDHVKSGIFLHGEVFKYGKNKGYEKSSNFKEWTHLMLKTQIAKGTKKTLAGERKTYDTHIFRIKINSNFIFFNYI